MTRTPKLDRKLVLESRQLLPDGTGGFAESWISVGTHWASIAGRTGQERVIGGRLIPRTGCRITVRASPDGSPSRPQAKQRFREGARIFAILAVTQCDHNKLFLECWADEGIA